MTQEAPKNGHPRLKIESFAPSKAYSVGQNSITLIATVRNVGDAPLPEGSVTGRLTCVSGLEYTEGDTIPKLPALDPNAVMNYHWRVTPTSNTGALVAAFARSIQARRPTCGSPVSSASLRIPMRACLRPCRRR